MTLARGSSFDILRWFFSEYDIFDKDTKETVDGFKEVAMEYLCHQASVILAYGKKFIKELPKESDPSMSASYSIKELEAQINLCIRGREEIPPIKSFALDDEKILNLTFPNKDKYMVRKLEESRPHQCQYPLIYRIFS